MLRYTNRFGGIIMSTFVDVKEDMNLSEMVEVIKENLRSINNARSEN